MTKKIFDILPPKSPKPPATFRKENFKQVDRVKPIKRKKVVRSKKGLIFILLALILVGIFGYFQLPRAEIEIWPVTEVLNFNVEITVGKEIPGEHLEEEKSFSQEFPSSGEILKTERAQGIIRVFNNYHLNQDLVANTRFWCFIDGEVREFRTKERKVIPSKKYLDIEVIASEPGEEYNIKPCTFAIPGLRGTPRYLAVYGESFLPMTGGFEEKVSQVTKEDLDQAENTLREKAFKDGLLSLKDKTPPDFILLEEAIRQEVLEIFALAQAGQELESFTSQVKVKTQGLAFKKLNLENFAKEYILTQIPKNKKFDPESLRINSSLESINWEAGKMILNLELAVKVYSDINQETLKRTIGGKSLKEAQILLENQPEIIKAKVIFWPFWVKKVPEDIDKIETRLNLDPVEKF